MLQPGPQTIRSAQTKTLQSRHYQYFPFISPPSSSLPFFNLHHHHHLKSSSVSLQSVLQHFHFLFLLSLFSLFLPNSIELFKIFHIVLHNLPSIVMSCRFTALSVFFLLFRVQSIVLTHGEYT